MSNTLNLQKNRENEKKKLNRKCKFSTVFIIIASVLLSGCSSSKIFTFKNAIKTENKNVIIDKRKNVLVSGSIILEEIFNNSDVDDKMRQLDVAKKRVAIEKTQGNIVFNATASAGIQSEYYDQTKPLLQTSLKAQKLLLDGQNLKKTIELLELDVEILGVDTFIEADKKINELTVAYTQLNFSQQSASLMSAYLNEYEKKKQLINKAVASGVLSKSKSLELKSLEKESYKKLTQFRFDVERSKDFINSNLASSYERLRPEFLSRQSINSSKIFAVKGNRGFSGIQW